MNRFNLRTETVHNFCNLKNRHLFRLFNLSRTVYWFRGEWPRQPFRIGIRFCKQRGSPTDAKQYLSLFRISGRSSIAIVNTDVRHSKLETQTFLKLLSPHLPAYTNLLERISSTRRIQVLKYCQFEFART